LVFGSRCAKRIIKDKRELPSVPKNYIIKEEKSFIWPLDRFEQLCREINRIMWEKVGIIRQARGLKEAKDRLEQVEPPSPIQLKSRFQLETINILQVAKLIVRFALFRQESRGGHYRSDFPHRNDSKWKHHSILSKKQELITL